MLSGCKNGFKQPYETCSTDLVIISHKENIIPSCKCRGNMCNSAEQSGVDQPSDSRKDNGFASDSDLHFICTTTTDGNGNIGGNFNDTSVEKVCNSGHSSLVNDSCCHKVLGTLPEQSCTISFADIKNVGITSSIENDMMDTLANVKEVVLTKPEYLEPEIDAKDRVKLRKEDMQETRWKETEDSMEFSGISDGSSGKTPFEVVTMPTLILTPELAAEAEGATRDTYKDAKELEMQATMDDTEVDHPSVAGPVGKAECHFTGSGDWEQKIITSKHDPFSLPEVNGSNEELPQGPREYMTCIDERHSTTYEMTDDQPIAISHKETISGSMQLSNASEYTDNDTVACIAASSQVRAEQIESKTSHSEQTMKETIAFHISEKLAPDMVLGSEELAMEHGQNRLKEACQDSSIDIEQRHANVQSIPQIVHALNMESNSGPELAEFFSNARGSEHKEEIEEQDHVPIRIKSPLIRKSYKESPRSLRMLLFSDETSLFAKKEEKYKRDVKSMEFSNKIVPAFECIGDESHNEDINCLKWHEATDNVEVSAGFSGPLAFSGALTYQGLISYTGPVAYSGSISHRSDSSTSTRSFAFPILASEWNSSPVKMGPPDPRFFRQQRKWHLCSCCARPSTLFD